MASVMRRILVVALGILLAATTFALPAAGEGGLTLLLFVTPSGPAVGDVVRVDVEAYMWASRTDLDRIVGQVRAGVDLNFTRTGAGAYRANYTVRPDDASLGILSFTARGERGGLTASGSRYAYVQIPFPSPGEALTSRFVGGPPSEYFFSPGQSFGVEARTYRSGALADSGTPTATLVEHARSGPDAVLERLTGTRASAGVFGFNFTLPAGVTTSTRYSVQTSLESANGTLSANLELNAHPVRAALEVTELLADSIDLRVLAWDAAGPVRGANVTASGVLWNSSNFTALNAGPVSAATDAAGSARVLLRLPLAAPTVEVTVNVSSGGKTTTLTGHLSSRGGPGGGTPAPPNPVGFSARLQSDPTAFLPGQNATLKIRVTDAAVPLAATSVTRLAYRSTAAGSTDARNITTDAVGNLTVSYTIPADWGSGESLTVVVVGPGGASDTLEVYFPGGGLTRSSRLELALGPAAPGKLLQVTARYTGKGSLEGVRGGAFLVPGRNTLALSAGLSGVPLEAELGRAGNVFSGQLEVPEWLPPGDHVLLVFITSQGATSSYASQLQELSSAVVHISAESAPTPEAGRVQVGQEDPSGFMLGVLVAAAVTGGLLEGIRRWPRKR